MGNGLRQVAASGTVIVRARLLRSSRHFPGVGYLRGIMVVMMMMAAPMMTMRMPMLSFADYRSQMDALMSRVVVAPARNHAIGQVQHRRGKGYELEELPKEHRPIPGIKD